LLPLFLLLLSASQWRLWGRWRWERVMLVEFTPLPLCFFCFQQCCCRLSLSLLFLPFSSFLSYFPSSFSFFFSPLRLVKGLYSLITALI
jgi:hypothetical protein